MDISNEYSGRNEFDTFQKTCERNTLNDEYENFLPPAE